MSFDGIVTRAVTEEVNRSLVSGRVGKIHQPFKTELTMTVRAHGQNHTLLLSAHSSFSRFHLTEARYENPPEPPMFCMLLRKHLEGSILESIEQDGMERIIRLSFKGRDELGDTSYKTLHLELMGRHSNIIFVDEKEQKVIDAIKHVPPSVSSVRTILPGHAFQAPPKQDKLNPLEVDEDTLLKKVHFQEGKLDQQLVDTFSGLSPLVSKEIIHRTHFANRETLPKAFSSVFDAVKNDDYAPQILETSKGEHFSVLDLTYLNGTKKTFDSVSKMLDRYFYGKAERDRVKQQANDLDRWLRNEYAKNKKKIKKLNKTLNDAEKAKKYQHYGELLTAHMHLAKTGDEEIEVIDYYDENQGTITIPLDVSKSPSENAQHYFKLYNKAKNSVAVVEGQIEKAKEDMAYFERLLQQVESAAPKDIAEIREELADEGYLKPRKTEKKKKKKKKQETPKPEKYRSSEGVEILVGKNNKQNEYVTNRIARQDDTWLHTKDIPGSHVVIRSADFGEDTLIEAAHLAAYFSKGRSSGQVPVDYTKIRHVRKPNGAKPGYVTYDNQTTLFVTPDEDLVYRLYES
ncbi:Rqc2 family fibronectin-binding protein [Texcoconibacillus texcoconensis]|uniref:Rqc2 homolog RqcH n=1 Tax=Texcoconibacillus texcoconensis TaxID=1095777 RepID=A0A840QL98_9BACI|nr:NFACT RNA binding domain-containing protein [Texcoconibacillus texcoconensis]MBB5172139.1 putative ribosome quality control (RQC) complex YloA/Tae2 family protein [Texcoconibacillus texcoconensis]